MTFRPTRLAGHLAMAFGSLALLPLGATGQTLERVEITGSAIKRIDAETALPVTVLTRDDIQKSGATTAAELLDRLSANNGQGYNQSLALGDSARPGFSGASLRGLGSNLTLVLLNGRRLAVYAFDGGGIDLNSIAVGALERIEVLRDGASAIYGTDAIAGVINFITRKDFSGADLSVRFVTPEKAGGRAKNATATLGFGDLTKDRFNIFGTFSYDKQENLKASQREFSKTAFLADSPSGRIDKTSGNTIPASILGTSAGTVNPGVPDCLPPASFRTSPVGPCRFDYASVIDIIQPQEKLGGLLRGTLQLTPNHELYSEYNRTRTQTISRVSPVPASSATTFNGDPVLYPAGGKYYPKAINPATGLLENGVLWYNLDPADPTKLLPTIGRFIPLSGDLSIAWRSLDAGPRSDQATATQDRVVLGGKGTFGNWDYDAAFMRSTSKVTDAYVDGWLYESKLLNSTGLPTDATYQVGTLNPDINPFGFNDAAGIAALNAAKVLGPVRESKSTRTGVDGKITGELMQLPAGAVAMAIGGEYRREAYIDNPLAVLNSGDVIGGGGNQLPVDGKRNVTAVFGEVSVPVLKDLSLLAQLRYDKYSDFGNTTNPKFGLRWQPFSQLLVRGSYNTGFRAPTLPELFLPVTQTNTGNTYNDPFYESKVGNCYDAAGAPTIFNDPKFCSAQLTVKQGGNPNLEPEKSRQHTVGFVLQPAKDVSIGVDFWNTTIKKQIGIPDSDTRLADFISQYLVNPNIRYNPTTAKLTAEAKAALAANNFSDPNIHLGADGNFGDVTALYDNVASLTTKGIDLAINTRVRTPIGEIKLGLEGTYINSYKQDGVELAGRYLQFGPVVRWKDQVNLGWSDGAWDVGYTYNMQSSYLDQGEDRVVGVYETMDIAVGYRGFKGLTLRAGIKNFLDRKPPFSGQGDYFQVGYDPTYADVRGRTYTFGVQYQF